MRTPKSSSTRRRYDCCLPHRRVHIFAAQHLEDSRVAVRRRNHPIGLDGPSILQFHAYRDVVLHQDALYPGKKTNLPAQVRDVLFNQPDHRLRPADRVSRVPDIHPRQRKNQSDGRHVAHVPTPEKALQQWVGEPARILLPADLRELAEQRKVGDDPQQLEPVVLEAARRIPPDMSETKATILSKRPELVTAICAQSTVAARMAASRAVLSPVKALFFDARKLAAERDLAELLQIKRIVGELVGLACRIIAAGEMRVSRNLAIAEGGERRPGLRPRRHFQRQAGKIG